MTPTIVFAPKDIAQILGIEKAVFIQQIHVDSKCLSNKENRFYGNYWTVKTKAGLWNLAPVSDLEECLSYFMDKNVLIQEDYPPNPTKKMYRVDTEMLDVLLEELAPCES